MPVILIQTRVGSKPLSGSENIQILAGILAVDA